MLNLKQIYNLLLTSFLITGLIIASSCRKDDPEIIDNDTIPINHIIDTLTGLGHEQSGDYTWDANSVTSIILQGSSISANSPNVTVNGSLATITAQGNYIISGTLDNGSIIIDAGKEDLVRIILQNATIHNSTGPAVFIDKARKVIINLAGNSVNYLSDGPSYSLSDPDPNATLFSKADLTIFGSGSLNVDGDFKDGIGGKDGLIIKSGTYNIHTVDDGIRGKNYLIIQDADLSIESGGDGLKSDEQTDPKPGNVTLENTSLRAVTNGDGISAKGSIGINKGYYNIVSGGGNEADTSSRSQTGLTAGNAIFLNPDSVYIDAVDHDIDSHTITQIISGVFTLYSARAGIHSNQEIDVKDGQIEIIRAMEGFESHTIHISGSSINIHSIDDCFNATAGYDVDYDDQSLIDISGGYLMLDCILGDGIDSNGDIEISGGTVIIHGPQSAPDVAADFNGEMNINGGFLIGAGTNSELMEYPDSTSSQNSLVAIFTQSYPKNTVFNITDDQGAAIVTFIPNDQYQSVLFSSPALITGKTYRIYVEGSVSDPGIDGISGGVYTPGTLLTDFTLRKKVTVLPDLNSSGGH